MCSTEGTLPRHRCALTRQVELVAGVALVDRDELPVARVGLVERAGRCLPLDDHVVAPRLLQEEPQLQAGGAGADHAVLVLLRGIAGAGAGAPVAAFA